MAGLNLLQPLPFLQEPGEPSIPWRQWVNSFQTFLLAIGGSSFKPDRKRAILLHCLGMEGQRIFNTIPDFDTIPSDTNSFDFAIKLLEKQFAETVKVAAERYKFRQRGQESGESINSFVAGLRE